MPTVSVSQQPADLISSQSPIIFTLGEPNAEYTGSAFQYCLDVYLWNGSVSSPPTSPLYTMKKYPNTSGKGIFDISNITTSRFQSLAIENVSLCQWLKADAYCEWRHSGSISQSAKITINSYGTSESPLRVFDSYDLFPSAINTPIYNQPPFNSWPLQTDLVYVSSSALISDYGYAGVCVSTYEGTGSYPTIRYTGVYENGSTVTSNVTIPAPGPALLQSTNQIKPLGIFPGNRSIGTDPFTYGFPLALTNGGSDLKSYSITLVGGDGASKAICVDIVCEPKYTPVRIAWKNRYGNFDWFNFYKKSTSVFNTTERTYQPQLGTWEGSSFSYNSKESSTKRYIVDNTETLSVNSDWVPETFNLIMRQLLMSDEIYLVQGTSYTPLIIKTNSSELKKGVNDKLIRYSFDFELGRKYKLTL